MFTTKLYYTILVHLLLFLVLDNLTHKFELKEQINKMKQNQVSGHKYLTYKFELKEKNKMKQKSKWTHILTYR